MPRTRGRARRGAALVAAVALVGVAPVAFAEEALTEDFPAGFVARASAAGTRLTYGIPGFLVVSDFVDGGGPFSETAVDLSGGNAFASLPHPGQLVIAGPGLLAGFGGPSLPHGYPFYASASHPSVPEAAVGDPTGSYEVTADAGPAAAVGVARLSTGEPDGAAMQLTTKANVEHREDGSLVAKAESVIQALSLGDGVLTIARLLSRSVTTAAPQTEPKTEDMLVIEGASVGGTPVTIGRDGVKVVGAELPAGPSAAEGVNEALAAAGLAVRMVEGQAVEGGRRGALLEVRSLHPVPGGPTGDLALQFGAVSSSVLLGGPATAPEVHQDATPSAGAAGPAPAAVVDTSQGIPVSPAASSGEHGAGARPAVAAPARGLKAPAFLSATGRAVPRIATNPPSPAAMKTGSTAVFDGRAGRASVPPAGGQLAALPAANAGALRADIDSELKTLYVAMGLTALALTAAGGGRRRKKGVVPS